MKAYNVDEDTIGCGCMAIIMILFVGIMLLLIFGNLCLDFASGSHRIIPTAVDNDMWGNYKVYYRTTAYTKNSEEDFYYIDKNNTKLADDMREDIKNGKEVIVYYDKYVGFMGISAPKSSPITKIEVIQGE